MNREKRVHPRVWVSRPLVYQSDIDKKTRVASTKDLSLGGARIENSSFLYCQESLNLWFSLEQRIVPCRGTVVHVQQAGDKFSAGIRFESITDEDRMVLSQYLSNLMEEKSDP